MAQIPSGGSPLFLGDFATPMNAVSQRMIGTMLDRQAQKQEQQSKSQKALLEALDFSAIEGLSDQVSQELLDKQNAIEDKWSQQYLENDMVLSDQQRFELRKDMREYERYAAKLKYNVAQAAYVQKELASPNAPEKYDLSSWGNLVKFQQSGGKGDASQILRPAYNVNSMVDDLTADWEDANLYDTKEEADYKKGIKTVTRTNVEALNDRMVNVLQDPNVQRMLNHPQYGPKLKAGLAKRYEDLKNEQTKEEVISPQTLIAEQKRQAASNLPKDTREKLQKYPQWQNVKPDEIPNVEYFNDFAARVLRRDQKALDLLKQKNLTGFGIPQDVVVDKEGGITLYNDKDETIYIPPTDWSDADNVRQSMTNVLNLVPSTMGGKQIPDNMQSWLVPDYEVDVKEEAPITAVQNVRDALDASEGDLKPEEREKVIQNLKIVFPESEFDVKKNYSPIEKRRKIKWDGEEYDLITEEGRNKLFDEIDSRLGRGGEDAGTEVAPTEKPPLPQATQEAANTLRESYDSYEELIADQMETSGRTRAEVEQRVQQLGISPQDFGKKKDNAMRVAPDVELDVRRENVPEPRMPKSQERTPSSVRVGRRVTAPDVNVEESSVDDSGLLSERLVANDPVIKEVTPRKRITQEQLDEIIFGDKKDVPWSLSDNNKKIKTSVKVTDAPIIDSTTFEEFRKIVGDVKYSQEKRFEEGYADCSSAVCRVLGIPNKKGAAVSAEDIYNGKTTTNNRPIEDIVSFIEEAKDGQLVFMNADRSNDKGKRQGIDHVAMVVVDKKTGEKYLAEVAKNSFMDGAYLSPLSVRMESLRGSKFYVADYAGR